MRGASPMLRLMVELGLSSHPDKVKNMFQTINFIYPHLFITQNLRFKWLAPRKLIKLLKIQVKIIIQQHTGVQSNTCNCHAGIKLARSGRSSSSTLL